MKRILFISALTLTSLILLIIVIAGIFLTTLDLNDYKVRVEKAIEKATGRHIVFEGKLTHSFFPLGLRTGPAYIQDQDIYGSEPLLLVKDISLKANIIALMQGDIVIDELTLQGLTVKLAVSSTGKKNWELEDKHKQAANVIPLEDERISPSSPSEELTNISGGIINKRRFGLYIKSIHANNAKIIYKNLLDNTAWELEKASTFISNVGKNKKMLFELSGDLIANGHPARASIDATLLMSSDKTVQIDLSSLEILNKDSTRDLPELSVSASLFYDANLKNVSISDVKGTFNTTPFSGIFAIMLPGCPNLEKNINWDIRGEAHIGSFYAENMRNKLTTLGIISPQIKTLQGNSPVVLTPDYRKKTNDSKEQEKKIEKLASPLPNKGIQFISHAFIAIDTTIERIVWKNAILEEVVAKPLVVKGMFEMPYSFTSYGGKVEGSATARVTNEKLSWSLTTKANGLKAEFLPIQIARENKITGTIAAQAEVKGKGTSWKETLPTIDGVVSFIMSKGKVTHAHLLPSEIRQKYHIPEEYPIESASFSSRIKNGVATTSDIKFVSPLLNAQGKGNVNLISEELHLDVNISAKDAPSIPLLIRGTISNPAYTIDAQSLTRNIVVQEVTKKIEDAEKKIEEKIGKKLKSGENPKKLLQNIRKIL